MILSILCESRVQFTNRIPIQPFHAVDEVHRWIFYMRNEKCEHISAAILLLPHSSLLSESAMLWYSDTLVIWCKSYKWIYRHRIAIMSYNTVTVIVLKTFNFVWFDDNRSGFDNQTEPVSVCFCYFFSSFSSYFASLLVSVRNVKDIMWNGMKWYKTKAKISWPFPILTAERMINNKLHRSRWTKLPAQRWK